MSTPLPRDRSPIPALIWRQMLRLLREIPEHCPTGAEIVLTVSPEGEVTGVKCLVTIE